MHYLMAQIHCLQYQTFQPVIWSQAPISTLSHSVQEITSARVAALFLPLPRPNVSLYGFLLQSQTKPSNLTMEMQLKELK